MRYFEDFEVGEAFETGGRTIKASDISNYVQLCGLYEEAFVNEEFMREETMFGEPFAPGELVLSFALGNVARTGYLEADIVLVGLEVDFVNPVLPDDTIYVESSVSEKRETSDGKRGIIKFDDIVRNQRDEEVMEMTKTTLVRRSPS